MYTLEKINTSPLYIYYVYYVKATSIPLLTWYEESTPQVPTIGSPTTLTHTQINF
jgi:hypothetical protein